MNVLSRDVHLTPVLIQETESDKHRQKKNFSSHQRATVNFHLPPQLLLDALRKLYVDLQAALELRSKDIFNIVAGYKTLGGRL